MTLSLSLSLPTRFNFRRAVNFLSMRSPASDLRIKSRIPSVVLAKVELTMIKSEAYNNYYIHDRKLTCVPQEIINNFVSVFCNCVSSSGTELLFV